MNVFTKRTQKRKQKRLKRKSLETERLKAQHGLQDSTDIIIVEHSNTLTVMIQAAGQKKYSDRICGRYECTSYLL